MACHWLISNLGLVRRVIVKFCKKLRSICTVVLSPSAKNIHTTLWWIQFETSTRKFSGVPLVLFNFLALGNWMLEFTFEPATSRTAVRCSINWANRSVQHKGIMAGCIISQAFPAGHMCHLGWILVHTINTQSHHRRHIWLVWSRQRYFGSTTSCQTRLICRRSASKGIHRQAHQASLS